MNLFSVGQAYNTVVPDVYIIEDMGLPSIDTNLGTQTIGMVGDALWGGEVVYESSNAADLARLMGGAGGDLGAMIDATRAEGRFNIAALRVLGAGAATAGYSLAAGADTTWDFEWEFAGAKGNDTTLQVIAGDIADTVTLIFKLDGDFIRVRNVNNDPDSENYVGTKWNVANMTFTKTGTAETLPSVTVTDAEFTTGADGATPSDADLLLAAQELLGSTDVTHFMFACRSNAALIAGIELLAGEFPQVIFFQTPIEDELLDENAACVTEAKEFTLKNVVTCMGNVYYYNPVSAAVEELEQIGFVTIAAKYAYADSPIGKKSNFRWAEVWSTAEREAMSEVHLSYARRDSRGWFINDMRTGVRDYYQSSLMVRSAYNTIERVIASSMRDMIGLTGTVSERRSRVEATLTGLGEYFLDRRVLDDYRVDTSTITQEAVSRGELPVDFYVLKNPETRYAIVTVKRMSDGSVRLTEEVL
ncbi:MAG TPA: hypothetical protein HA367_08290 [Candidatus Methanofastidiosum sp.]|nr:hypothetical protein [Methanofastidiosum sp.]